MNNDMDGDMDNNMNNNMDGNINNDMDGEMNNNMDEDMDGNMNNNMNDDMDNNQQQLRGEEAVSSIRNAWSLFVAKAVAKEGGHLELENICLEESTVTALVEMGQNTRIPSDMASLPSRQVRTETMPAVQQLYYVGMDQVSFANQQTLDRFVQFLGEEARLEALWIAECENAEEILNASARHHINAQEDGGANGRGAISLCCLYLVNVDLRGHLVDVEGFGRLVRGVECLWFNGCGLDGPMKQTLCRCLRDCGNITNISFDCCALGDACLQELSLALVPAAGRLRELQLRFNDLTSQSIAPLSRLIGHCRDLEELDLSSNENLFANTQANNGDFVMFGDSVGSIPNLKVLQLGGCGMDGELVLSLFGGFEGTPSLRLLDIVNASEDNITGISRALAAGLLKFPNLLALHANLDLKGVPELYKALDRSKKLVCISGDSAMNTLVHNHVISSEDEYPLKDINEPLKGTDGNGKLLCDDTMLRAVVSRNLVQHQRDEFVECFENVCDSGAANGVQTTAWTVCAEQVGTPVRSEEQLGLPAGTLGPSSLFEYVKGTLSKAIEWDLGGDVPSPLSPPPKKQKLID